MSVAVKHKEIIDKLYGMYQSNGFISEDDALDAMVALKLPLHEIDIVSDHLLSMGVLIRSEDVIEDDEDDNYDKSKIDYEALFDEVLSIAPELDNFINTVREIQPPQNREWRNLMPQAKNGNQYAYNRLFEMYLRVVVKMALSFHKKYDVPLEDTIQEGAIGLLSALDKFELGKQELFTTYAPWWIRQAIQREMDFTPFPLLYFPAHFQERLYSIYELIEGHYCEECEMSVICNRLIFEVSEKLECNFENAETYIRFYKGTTSIEDILSEDENASTIIIMLPIAWKNPLCQNNCWLIFIG